MSEHTIVITGASSGIGEATALRFAKQQANLVLVARGRQALEVVAKKCRDAGASVVVVPADVSDGDAVRAVAWRAVETFGQIDVWINNAGVISYGPFLSLSPTEFQRVIDVNLLGCVYGSQAALRQFQTQATGGTLINVASGYGAFPAPYASAYVASKFAIRGLSASIRQELAAEGTQNIHVCTVLPATIDTPIYHHPANTTGYIVKALPPAYPAAVVAKTIDRLVAYPRAEMVVGYAIAMPARLYGLMPGIIEKAMGWYISRRNYTAEPQPATNGNMYQSYATGDVSGGWPTWQQRTGKIIGAVVLMAGLSWWYTRTRAGDKS